ncbi:hypothetical protein M9Y10_013590 [Tritrichomonas musculus]|uniref:DUF3447 domain-containing protein n=1 Tax=Tritrichomonas musculus TaxID=1915356 RepID=A0ABR2KX58_9EUKA
MSYQDYINKMKDIQEDILNFVDDKDNQNDYFNKLINAIKIHNIQQNHDDLMILLHLIASISNNHHRGPFFFEKIERILNFLKEDIKKNFPNFKIFNIFKDNKRILLFLIKEDILKVDSSIKTKMKNMNSSYFEFFSPEVGLNFHDDQPNFLEKRKIGENDDNLCSIIRNDMIDEFVTFVNTRNVSLSYQFKTSIYETNPFLIDKNPTLIEYAAFFGSIQIFNYLRLNKVDLTPSLWIYAIHSNNAEIISLLENNKIEPNDKKFNECFKESVKCHHNEIATYIKEQKIEDEEDEKESVDENGFNKKMIDTFNAQNCIRYYNFCFIQDDFMNGYNFNVLCECDYVYFVSSLIDKESINPNANYI